MVVWILSRLKQQFLSSNTHLRLPTRTMYKYYITSINHNEIHVSVCVLNHTDRYIKMCHFLHYSRIPSFYNVKMYFHAFTSILLHSFRCLSCINRRKAIFILNSVELISTST